jgi:hypothetical protein
LVRSGWSRSSATTSPYVELHEGRSDRARILSKEARTQARRTGCEALYPYLVGDLAVIAGLDGDASAAARLAGAAVFGGPGTLGETGINLA